MHQQEEATVVKFTEQDNERLIYYIREALTIVTKIHLTRFPSLAPQLYKIFISKKGQIALRLPANLERGFEFNGKRAIMYTSKPDITVEKTYVTCLIPGNEKNRGSQSVLYLEEPTPPGPICITK